MLEALYWSFLIIFILTAFITLLGIVENTNVQIKKGFLKPIYYALLIELIGAVLILYKHVDWQAVAQPRITELTVQLPETLKSNNPVQLATLINGLYNRETKQANTIKSLNKQVNALNQKLKTANVLKGTLVQRIARLEVYRKFFQGFINPTHEVPGKKEANLILQSILMELEIGGVTRLDGDGNKTKEALNKFAETHNLKIDGYVTTDDIRILKVLASPSDQLVGG